MYQTSDICQQQLFSVEAIDFFMARQVVNELGCQQDELLLHLFIGLQWSQRQGHSCLPLSAIAQQHCWHSQETEHPGYVFFHCRV